MAMKSTVIGSGFGGLAAALRLRARGLEVRVVERQSQLGGRATVYRKDGYTFDAGPTVVTAPFLFDELFELFGKDARDYFTLTPVDPWYRIRFADGVSFDYTGSLERTLDQIRQLEPRDVDGYLRFLADTDEIYRIGFEELGDQPFDDPWLMLKVLAKMASLRSDRSVYRRASKYLRSPYLRQVFSFQPLLVGGNPFTTTSIYSLIHVLERKFGVHFALGGTTSIVAGLTRLMREEGISIHTGETVDEIEIENGRVQGVHLASGERVASDIVVCNADPPHVYKNMIADRHRGKWTDRKLARMRYSMGLFVVYFGARKQFPNLAHHEILLGPRYQGLLEDIFDKKRLAPDFSLYLHAPTRTDPSLAPPGSESMYALAPVPNLQGDVDWEREAEPLKDRILASIEDRVCPGLRDVIDVEFHVTPQHFATELLSLHGSGFSIQPTLLQSAYFRFHNRSKDIRQLYFVGAGTHPGAGMPGVLTSAKVLERALDEDGLGRPRAARSAAQRTAVLPAPKNFDRLAGAA